MSFEWDPAKNQSNAQKHGIDFEDAVRIFEGFVLEAEDWRYSQDESRVRAIGEIHGLVFFVVYTWRGNKQRIISARLATPSERKIYFAKRHND